MNEIGIALAIGALIGELVAVIALHLSLVRRPASTWQKHVEFYEHRRQARYDRKLARAERAKL